MRKSYLLLGILLLVLPLVAANSAPQIAWIDLKTPISIGDDIYAYIDYYDVNGDIGTITVNWTVNGAPKESQTYLTASGDETLVAKLSAHDFIGNETISLSVTATDGTVIIGPVQYRTAVFQLPISEGVPLYSVACDTTDCFMGTSTGTFIKANKFGIRDYTKVIQSNAAIWNMACDNEYCYLAVGNAGVVARVRKSDGFTLSNTIGGLIYSIDCDDTACFVGRVDGSVLKISKDLLTTHWTANPTPTLVRRLSCTGAFCYGVASNKVFSVAKDTGSVNWTTTIPLSAGKELKAVDCYASYCYVADSEGYLYPINKATGMQESAKVASNTDITSLFCDISGCYYSDVAGSISRYNYNDTFAYKNRAQFDPVNAISCDTGYCFGITTTGKITKMAKEETIRYPVFGCGVLDAANRTYYLQQDLIAQNDCFLIRADNITIDGNGRTISFGKTCGETCAGIILEQSIKGLTLRELTINGSGDGLKSAFPLTGLNMERVQLNSNVTMRTQSLANSTISLSTFQGTVELKDAKSVLLGENNFTATLRIINSSSIFLDRNTFSIALNITSGDNNTLRENTFANATLLLDTASHNNTLYDNVFGNGFYIINQESSNKFTTTADGKEKGNYYYGVEALDINDSDYSGYGDIGADWPVRQASFPANWEGFGTDTAPVTFKQIPITCQNLTQENKTYYLQGDVLAPINCFNISASGITIDGRGHMINWTPTCCDKRGIAVTNVDRFTLKNVKIQMLGDCYRCSVLYMNNVSNARIEGNTFKMYQYDDSWNLYIMKMRNSTFANNRIEINNQNNFETALFSDCSDNIFRKNTIISSSIETLAGMRMISSPRNTFFLNTFTTRGKGLHLDFGSHDNIIESNTFNIVAGTGLLYEGAHRETIINNNFLVQPSNAVALQSLNSLDATVDGNVIDLQGTNDTGVLISEYGGNVGSMFENSLIAYWNFDNDRIQVSGGERVSNNYFSEWGTIAPSGWYSNQYTGTYMQQVPNGVRMVSTNGNHIDLGYGNAFDTTKRYRVQINVSSLTTGRIWIDGIRWSRVIDRPGFYTMYVDPSSTSFSIRRYSGSENFSAVISYISIREIDAVAKDSSGHGHDGLYYMGASINNTEFGQSLLIKPDNQGFVRIPAANLNDTPQNYTVSAWFNAKDLYYIDSASRYNQIFGKDYDELLIMLVNHGADTCVYEYLWKTYQGPGSSQAEGTCNSQFADNTWTHIAVSFNAESRTAVYYLNGKYINQIGFGNGSTYYDPFYDYFIGLRGGGGDPFYGQIDEVMFFNETLTEDQVKTVYLAAAKKAYGKSATRINKNLIASQLSDTSSFEARNTQNILLQDNIFTTGGSRALALFIDTTNNITLQNNKLTGFGTGAYCLAGSEASHFTTHTITRTTTDGAALAFNVQQNVRGQLPSLALPQQLVCLNCANFTLQNINRTSGLTFIDSTGVTLQNISIASACTGISFVNSTQMNISTATIKSTANTIEIIRSANSSASGLDLTSYLRNAVNIVSSTNITLRNTNTFNADVAILLQEAKQFTIENGHISGNKLLIRALRSSVTAVASKFASKDDRQFDLPDESSTVEFRNVEVPASVRTIKGTIPIRGELSPTFVDTTGMAVADVATLLRDRDDRVIIDNQTNSTGQLLTTVLLEAYIRDTGFTYESLARIKAVPNPLNGTNITFRNVTTRKDYAAIPIDPAIHKNKIVAYYPLDYDAFLIVHDISGNERHGEKINTSLANGTFRYAPGQQILLPSPILAPNYTYSLWLSNNTFDRAGVIFFEATAGGDPNYALEVTSPDSIRFLLQTSFGPSTTTLDVRQRPQTPWHHLLIEVREGNVTLTLDGNISVTATFAGQTQRSPLNQLRIGSAYGAQSIANGSIDEILILNASLTPDEKQLLLWQSGIIYSTDPVTLQLSQANTLFRSNRVRLTLPQYQATNTSKLNAKVYYQTRNYSRPILSRLVAYFPADGDFSVVNKYTDNAYNYSYVPFAQGVHGQAFDFRNANGPVQLDAQYIPELNKDMTISFWAKYNTTFNNGEDLSMVASRGWGNWEMFTYNDRYFVMNYATGVPYTFTGRWLWIPQPLTNGNWTHYTYVFDLTNQQLKVYVNGNLTATALITTKTLWAPEYAGNPLAIGSSPYDTGAGPRFKGQMDEIFVFDTALQQEDVNYLYHIFDNGTFSIYTNATSNATESIEKEIIPNRNSLTPAALGNISSGLVAWKSFDSLTSDRLPNISHTLDQVNETQLVPGQFGTAYRSNGYTSALRYRIPPMPKTNGYTISTWFKKDGPGTLDNPNVVGQYPNYHIRVLNDGRLCFLSQVSTVGSYPSFCSSPGYIVDGQWYHAVGVLTAGGFVQLYVNGELMAQQGPYQASTWNIDYIDVGLSWTTDGWWRGKFNGTVDEVMLWNRPLSPDEISTLYEHFRPAYVIFEIPETASTVRPVLTLETGANTSASPFIEGTIDVAAYSYRPQTNEYTLQIGNSTTPYYYYNATFIKGRTTPTIILQKPKADIRVLYGNDHVQRYKYYEGKSFIKNITIVAHNSTVTNIQISPFQELTIGADFISDVKQLTSCHTVPFNQNCTASYLITLKPGKIAPVSANFMSHLRYRNMDGTFTEMDLPFYIKLEAYAELQANESILVFNEPRMNETKNKSIRFTNVGSSSTGAVTINTPQYITFYDMDDNQVTFLNDGILATGSLNLRAEMKIGDYSERTLEGNITFVSSVMNQSYPYRIIVNQSLSLSNVTQRVEPGSAVQLQYFVSNDGNIFLSNPYTIYRTQGLPSQWISYDTTEMPAYLDVGQTFQFRINLSIPNQTVPGTYRGIIEVHGDNTLLHPILVEVMVPENRSWQVRPYPNQSVPLHITPTPEASQLPAFNVTNKGNVPISFNVSLSNSNVGNNPFPQSKYDATPDFIPLRNFTVAPGSTFEYPLYVQTYSRSADGLPNMGIRLNFSITNTENASYPWQAVSYIINVQDAAPQILSWRNEKSTKLSDYDGMEINRTFQLQVRAKDDGGLLNDTTAYFLVNDGTTTTRLTPFSIDNTTITHAYYTNFTPDKIVNYTIGFYVNETLAGGNKQGNATIILSAATRPTDVFIAYGAISTNKVNTSVDAVLSVPVSFKISGFVQVYNMTIGIQSWNATNVTYAEFSRINELVAHDLNLTVPRGSDGIYNLTIYLNFTNPDRTSSLHTRNITLTIDKNYDLLINATPIVQAHGTTKFYKTTLRSIGTGNTTITLSANSTHAMRFNNGVGYYNPAQYISLRTGETKDIFTEVTVARYSSGNSTAVVYATNAAGKVFTLNIPIQVLDDVGFNTSEESLTINSVVGNPYSNTFFSITNKGNVPIAVNISFNGSLTSPELLMTSENPITLAPGETKSPRINFTPVATGTYVGSIELSALNVSKSLPVTLNALNIQGTLRNISNNNGKSAGDVVAFAADLLSDGQYVTQGIILLPTVGGKPCIETSYVPVIEESSSYLSGICKLPVLEDGKTYAFNLRINYNHPTLGSTLVTIPQSAEVTYRDLTPPRISSIQINDVMVDNTGFAIIKISDNVVIDGTNYFKYVVTGYLENTQTYERVQMAEFNPSLVDLSEHSATFKLPKPGKYRYVIAVTDADGNTNSSLNGVIEGYEIKRFYKDFTYNLSGMSIKPQLDVIVSKEGFVDRHATFNGVLDAVLRTGQYNITIDAGDYTFRFKKFDVDKADPQNIFEYQEMSMAHVVSNARPLVGNVEPQRALNGFLIKTNQNIPLRITYDYLQYVSDPHDLNVFICRDYNTTLQACGEFWRKGNVADVNSREYVIDSPVATIEDRHMAIIFFQHAMEKIPYPVFSQNSFDLSMAHDSNQTIILDISSANYGEYGAPLENIQITCDTINSDRKFCENFYIQPVTVYRIGIGQQETVNIKIRSMHGLAPQEYRGVLRYTSNNGLIEQQLPITIRVLSTPQYELFYNTNDTRIGGTGSEVVLDTLFIKNTGNTLVDLPIAVGGAQLLSAPSVQIAPNKSIAYSLRIQAPDTTGYHDIPVQVGTNHLTYSLNIRYALAITSVQPANFIDANETLRIHFDLEESNGEATAILQSYAPYFDSYRIMIGGKPCASDPDEDLTLYTDLPDVIECQAPTIVEEAYAYPLTLTLVKNGVTVTTNTSVQYTDRLPPLVANITKNITYEGISTIALKLFDRNGISPTPTVDIYRNEEFNQTISVDLLGIDQTLTVVPESPSEATVVLQHNFSAPGQYRLEFHLSDQLDNEGGRRIIASHFPRRPFTRASFGTAGAGSAIISRISPTYDLYDPSYAKVQLTIPRYGDVLYNQTLDFRGNLPLNDLEERMYDLDIEEELLSVLLHGVNYTGQPVLAYERIDVSDLPNARLGFGFEATNFTSATLIYRSPKEGSLQRGYFIVCDEWDYKEQVCQGNETSMNPSLSYATEDAFTYELNVTHFSAYTLIVPTAPLGKPAETGGDTVVVTAPSSGGGGGGGGGGGVKLEDFSNLLDKKVGNLSTVSVGSNDVKVDSTLIEQNLYPGETISLFVDVLNAKNYSLTISAQTTPELEEIIELSPHQLSLEPRQSQKLSVKIYAPTNGSSPVYDGFVKLHYENEFISIPVKVRILEAPGKEPSLRSAMITPKVKTEESIKVDYYLEYPYTREIPAILEYAVVSLKSNEAVHSETMPLVLNQSVSWTKTFELNKTLPPGDYFVEAKVQYITGTGQARTLFVKDPVEVQEFFLFYRVYSYQGQVLRVWHIIALLIGILAILIAARQYRKYLESRKKYHLPVDLNSLPVPSTDNGYIGYLAETNIRAFVNFDTLTTHTLVAGSTGGGKSFSAQVIVEEALLHNVAVVVFDPTAQWSGFLRKQSNPDLLKMYPKFGLDPKKDPRSFKGNIRRISNPREIIGLNEYLKPGEITIFDCHKMTFEEIDLFVANTVSQVFMSELEESRDLKLLMVYDEVHRLLPKFGGSGAGFMQVERACREFRKWGIGLLLISQVLSDFVGQTKANINTEIQMRTRDEEDLKRLSMKYGEELLRSVVKAEVGTGMLQNSKYNLGRPYLVSFRPLLHSVERLTEKELMQYDQYNAKLLDFTDSAEQLAANNVDILDVQVEINLAYDKLKEGKFEVASIYVEELELKLTRMWERLGKKPKKRETKLLSDETIKKFIELAKQQHLKAETQEKQAPVAPTPPAASAASSAPVQEPTTKPAAPPAITIPSPGAPEQLPELPMVQKKIEKQKS